MQTFFIFTPTVNSQRGAHVSDPSIEDSGLGALIKQTFADLQLPMTVGGCLKLLQRQDNQDGFDLCFFSNVHSTTYREGGIYTARDIAHFERNDFEDYRYTESHSRRRLQEFARRLVAGELLPA